MWYTCLTHTWWKILRHILENLWKTGSHPGSNQGPLTLTVSALPPEPWPLGDSQPLQFSLSLFVRHQNLIKDRPVTPLNQGRSHTEWNLYTCVSTDGSLFWGADPNKQGGMRVVYIWWCVELVAAVCTQVTCSTVWCCTCMIVCMCETVHICTCWQYQQTALSMAVRKGYHKIVQLLLEGGADPNRLNNVRVVYI